MFFEIRWKVTIFFLGLKASLVGSQNKSIEPSIESNYVFPSAPLFDFWVKSFFFSLKFLASFCSQEETPTVNTNMMECRFFYRKDIKSSRNNLHGNSKFINNLKITAVKQNDIQDSFVVNDKK